MNPAVTKLHVPSLSEIGFALQRRAGGTPAALKHVPVFDQSYLTVSGAYLVFITTGSAVLFFAALLSWFGIGSGGWGHALSNTLQAGLLAGLHYVFMSSFYKILMAGELNGMGPRRLRKIVSIPMAAKGLVALLFGFVAALCITLFLQAPGGQTTTAASNNPPERIAAGTDYVRWSEQYYAQTEKRVLEGTASSLTPESARTIWHPGHAMATQGLGLMSLPFASPLLWWLTPLCALLLLPPLVLVEFRRRDELVCATQLHTAVTLAESHGFVEGKYAPPTRANDPMARPHHHVYAKAILQSEKQQLSQMATFLQSERRRWLRVAKHSRDIS